MSKYNKVYFLHIPKTGGRFFTRYIIDKIEDTLKENGITVIRDPLNAFKHSGWHKDIDENTYVISLFRDPIEFFVSAACHTIYEDNKMTDKFNDNIVIKGSPILDIEKETLYYALEKFHFLKNFQSKNFALSPRYGSSTVAESMRDQDLKKEFDESLAYERIKRVNLLIRQSDFKVMDYSKIVSKLSEDLDVDLSVDFSFADKEKYKNDASEVLFRKLSKEDMDAFSNNFLFDKKIYEDDSLFWKP